MSQNPPHFFYSGLVPISLSHLQPRLPAQPSDCRCPVVKPSINQGGFQLGGSGWGTGGAFRLAIHLKLVGKCGHVLQTNERPCQKRKIRGMGFCRSIQRALTVLKFYNANRKLHSSTSLSLARSLPYKPWQYASLPRSWPGYLSFHP